MENSVSKRLNMQNEVLKWLEDFSENLQNRANATTVEIHELLDQAKFVKQDLNNTFNSFRNLSYLRVTENTISEQDELTGHMKEDARNPEVGIPAQSYEVDILPRYRDALSLGLNSYRHHLQKTNMISSTGSFFKLGSARSPLPHIIGSEEYIHDNSCGLTNEDFISGTAPLDFGSVVEPNGLHPNRGERGSNDMLSADLFGMEQGPSEKDGEPMVSAALDFKAMLEAALLSPYKFYDESSSLPDAVSGNINRVHGKLDHVTSMTSNTVGVASSQHLVGIDNTNMPVTAGNLTFLQDSDFNTHTLCSALLSESLFDPEEEPPSIQESHEVFSTNKNETVLEAPQKVGDVAGEGLCSLASSSLRSQTESSSLLAERFMQFKIAKPIINDMSGREEPTFSTVVSVSQESGSLFSQPTLSSSCDLDNWSSSSKENNNISSFLEEKTVAKETFITRELAHKKPEAATEYRCKLEKGEPSIMGLDDGSVAVENLRECSVTEDPNDGGASLDVEESHEFQSCRGNLVPNDLSEVDEAQQKSISQQREDEGASTSSPNRSMSVTDEKKDDPKSSLITPLLKLPMRCSSLFDSDED
ncbi:uncharacterized protein LOC143883850 isoform X2 [Tasmannia lanceolata]|uniref:uncharacterized protein LOC143883850 isoform X2 n=1 Tax=Tasmannia lanceolata TaxID=3420 RepID=UPI0040645092